MRSTAPARSGRAAADEAVERAYREAYGRVLATIIRLLDGDFDAAEEALADALVAALETWPRDGLPANPAAWLTTAARNRALDVIRRDRRHADKVATLERDAAEAAHDALRIGSETGLVDDRLRLVFTCCHPALPLEARVALTLRTLGGLSTPEIARAFLVPEATMAQRLVRAKRKIREARIPYRVPAEADLPERLDGVLATLYLVFNEGYLASSGAGVVRNELCSEAIRLARVVAELLPDRAETHGLVALLLLHDSRRDARLDDDGAIRLLDDQDRSRWDKAEIDLGFEALERGFRTALLGGQGPGRYLLQAAIAAEHARTVDGRPTDWRTITGIYDALLRIDPSPVVELNRAVAVAQVEGPEAGLRLLEPLGEREELARYHLLPAARAELLRRLGRPLEAAVAYRRALTLADNDAERRFLRARLDAAESPPAG